MLLLLLFCGQGLDSVAQLWYKSKQSAVAALAATPSMNPSDVTDAEAVLQSTAPGEEIRTKPVVVADELEIEESTDKAAASDIAMAVDVTVNHRKLLLQSELRQIAVLLMQGVEGWTADARYITNLLIVVVSVLAWELV